MKIKVKKGLDIPLTGAPSGEVKKLSLPPLLALDLSPFEMTPFKLLKKEGEAVKVGEPIALDKNCSERLFVSPASGKISKLARGLKRRILSIVIETDGKQTPFETKGKTIFEAGLSPHICARPGLGIAHPKRAPEAIFVKAIESAPFAPPPELQVQGFETFFQEGIQVLKEFAPVHLVCRENDSYFSKIDANIHTATGPHPAGNPSVHIAAVHPITRNDQVVWTLNIIDVITLGRWKLEGVYHTERVISVGGEDSPGYYQVFSGFPMKELFKDEGSRIISGDPLMGSAVGMEGFLGFYHRSACSIKERDEKREMFHFLKLKRKGFTASKAYFFRKRAMELSTLLHGEERAFVDGGIYDRVMPLEVETMPLIKMLLTKDYERGREMGLLGVHPEDFALPTFICPSKIEMTEIVKEGLSEYAKEYLEF